MGFFPVVVQTNGGKTDFADPPRPGFDGSLGSLVPPSGG
jgi:hypothetical protein